MRKENFNNDKTLRGVGTLFESDNEDYYKAVKIVNAIDNN